MPRLRLWRFALHFVVLYAFLILPWPGLHHAVGFYVQAFGSRVFGQSGRAFMDSVAKHPTGSVPVAAHHMVLFRAKGSADNSYSAATDTIVVLYNFDVVDKGDRGGWKIGLESRNYFWLPFAFYLALVGATPMPWRRRALALFWGLVTANVLLALTLGAYIGDHASDISLIVLSPFWTWAVGGLARLLLVVSGPSTLVYLFLWTFACFRREDLIRLVPDWRDWLREPAVAGAPTRQQRRAQLRVERKLR
jgi:hypothetical protein